MVITFANQKGGVGKSTLCIMLATYWSSLGMKLKVIDADKQKALWTLRKNELENNPELSPLFDIESVEIDSLILELVERRKNEEILLIDIPGKLDADIMKVIELSDVVIVPFQFEEMVLTTTSFFAGMMDSVDRRHPETKRTFIFVPNAIEQRIGRKQDRDHWEAWKEAIARVSILAPTVYHRACLQRRNTISVTEEEMQAVISCFEFITDNVFIKQEEKDQE